MTIQFYIAMSLEVLIWWGIIFGASYQDGMSHGMIYKMIAAMVVAGGKAALKMLSDPKAPIDFPVAGKKAPVAGIVVALLICCFLFAGCAHTDIYAPDNKGDFHKIAHFEGDMTKQTFSYAMGKTRIAWKCDSVSHSAATLAQGQAGDVVLGGASTFVTSIGFAAAPGGPIAGTAAGLMSIVHTIFH